MEENKTTPNQNESVQNKDEKNLDELLKNPKLQSEFDKKLEGARLKWETSWKEKAEAEKSEAERLAKLTESERQKELLAQSEQARTKAESELNSFRLKEQAQKIAKEKNLDIDLLNVIDFSKENADTVKEKIDSLDSVFKKAIENAVNERLKQSAPRTVGNTSKNEVESYIHEKYKNSKFYKG